MILKINLSSRTRLLTMNLNANGNSRRGKIIINHLSKLLLTEEDRQTRTFCATGATGHTTQELNTHGNMLN